MLVSVCMATYNGAKYIKEQMDSILSQEFKENKDVKLEIIVSDDGSRDETLKIVESYKDPRIHIFHHTNRHHYRYYNASICASHNFENAMKHASGEYIFLADQDDIWYPWKMDVSLSKLKETGGGMVYTEFDWGDINCKFIGHHTYKNIKFWELKHIGVYGFCMCLSRQELRYILPIPSWNSGHDNWIQFSTVWRKRIHYISKPSALHRWDGKTSVSTSYGRHSKTNRTPPRLLQVIMRLNMYLQVIWRSFIIR